MPSFLDLLQSSSGDDDRPSSPSSAPDGVVPLDVLASVRHEGGRRRRRRQRRNLVVCGVALVAVAVPAFALLGGDGDEPEDVRSAELADAPSTTADDDRRPAPTTTSTTADPTEVLGVVIERPADEVPGATTTTARPRPATTVPATVPTVTEPPLVCSNSFDPACGAFSWSPPPSANGALSLSAPGGWTVPAGGSLVVTIQWSDPDATLRYTDHDGDGSPLLSAACASDRRYGPWTPPAPAGGAGTFEVNYLAPSQPGDYTFSVVASTYSEACEYDPYGNDGSITIPVTVTDAAPT